MNWRVRSGLLAGIVVLAAAGLMTARAVRRHALLAALCPLPIERLTPSAQALVARAADELRRDPSRSERWAEVGFALAANGASAEAVRCFARAEELDPSDYRWPYLWAVYTPTRESDAVVAALRRALECAPEATPAAALLAETYLEKGDDANAAAIVRPRVGDQTTDQRLLLAAARVEAAAGAADRALALAQRAAALPPRRRQVHVLLAQLYGRRHDAEGVRRESRLLELLPPPEEEPAWPDPLLDTVAAHQRGADTTAAQARILTASGRPADALRALGALTPEERASPPAAVAEALAKAHLGDVVEARRILAGVADQGGAGLWYARGVINSLQGDHAAAAEEFRRAALEGDFGGAEGAYCRLGACLRKLGRSEEAAAAFAQALRRRPGYLQALKHLALLDLERGRNEEATKRLADAALLDPEDREVQELQRRARAKG